MPESAAGSPHVANSAAAGHIDNLPMATTDTSPAKTPGYGLSEVQERRLVSLLKRIEEADSGVKAVWLDEESREVVAEIRKQIETNT